MSMNNKNHGKVIGVETEKRDGFEKRTITLTEINMDRTMEFYGERFRGAFSHQSWRREVYVRVGCFEDGVFYPEPAEPTKEVWKDHVVLNPKNNEPLFYYCTMTDAIETAKKAFDESFSVYTLSAKVAAKPADERKVERF